MFRDVCERRFIAFENKFMNLSHPETLRQHLKVNISRKTQSWRYDNKQICKNLRKDSAHYQNPTAKAFTKSPAML